MATRRDFLKLGAASAIATVAGEAPFVAQAQLIKGGKDFSPATGAAREAIPTACWQCVSRCPAIGYVENGHLVKIGGQPNSIRTEGKLCAKAQAGINQVYDPDRILYPLKRVGKRGEGKWKRISWDAALEELTGKLAAIRDSGHPEKFMFHYGRMKASSSKLIKSVFLANYGTGTIGNHTSICEGGKWTAQELTWGKHYDNWDFDNTQYVLNFGSNCLEAHTNHTSVAHRLIRAVTERRVKLVTFDVRLSNTAAKSTLWAPIRPGTDGAVALAMCNVIMSEDLYKGEGEEFLKFCQATPDAYASVADKVAALKAHLAQYTPEWAANESGVAAETIRQVAREFATTKPACLISYRGAVAHENGNDTERAIQMLAAITGNIDNPGGRCKAVGAKWKYPKGPKSKPKPKKLKIVDGFPGQAKLATHHMSHHVLKLIKDGRMGRPDVYMWYCYTPVYANGDVAENIAVLKDEKLIPYLVCINPFYDESAALADLILPDATYLERYDWEDMVSPAQIPEYYFRQPVVTPMGEVRDFADVACDLADRLGFPLGFSTKKEFVEKSCEKTKAVKALGGFEYMKQNGVWHDPKAKPKYYSYRKLLNAGDLTADGVILDEATGTYWNWKKAKAKSEDEARAKGYRHFKKSYKAYVGQLIDGEAYTGFKPDSVNKSGYFELYSGIMAEKGLSGLPVYRPIPTHKNLPKDKVILTTYKVANQTHSRTQNCKWLTEIFHENPGWLNPETAAAMGFSDGDRVLVKSEIGQVEAEVRVTSAVVPGVFALAHHLGHWEYGRYASGNAAPLAGDDDPARDRVWWSDFGTLSNWVIPNRPDPINGQQCWMDTVVTLTKTGVA